MCFARYFLAGFDFAPALVLFVIFLMVVLDLGYAVCIFCLLSRLQ